MCVCVSNKNKCHARSVHACFIIFPWHLHIQSGVDPAPVFRVMPVLFMIEHTALLVAFLKIIFQTGLGQGSEPLSQKSCKKTDWTSAYS